MIGIPVIADIIPIGFVVYDGLVFCQYILCVLLCFVYIILCIAPAIICTHSKIISCCPFFIYFHVQTSTQIMIYAWVLRIGFLSYYRTVPYNKTIAPDFFKIISVSKLVRERCINFIETLVQV